MERRALGRGISALIPEQTEEKSLKINLIKVDNIKPNPYQPRKNFDQESLDELIQSIRERGVIQPILVRRKGDSFELIAGERRFRAAIALKLQEIPAIIKEAEDIDSLELSLVENLQREDLNPIEEARAYQYMIEKFQYTQERISEVLGKSRVSVTNSLRLLKLPIEVQEELKNGRISFAHGRALLELDEPNLQRKIMNDIISNSLSVRELENIIKSKRKTLVRKHPSARNQDTYLAVIEEQLQHHLATKVNILKKKKRGKIIIEFFSDEDLNRIIKKLKGEV
ncbi:MAG: ParB/RepB/Spo0J family partition protein [Candidatus Omnitrophota bacterium]|jgi:ParB family chromosome partitioning protein|nr:MAG: ParB/RepB/Spo0J family partition protein [Candidatus Omnitrophota bacterium]